MRDPSTPSAMLEALSAPYRDFHDETEFIGLSQELTGGEIDDPLQLWKALVSNPNTSPQTLTYLSVLLPDEFCQNPVASLLPMEPQFIPWLEKTKRVTSLLRCAALPKTIANAIKSTAQNRVLREEAAFHVTLAGKITDENEAWRQEVRTALCARARRVRGYGRLCLLNLGEARSTFSWLFSPSALSKAPLVPAPPPLPVEREETTGLFYWRSVFDPTTPVGELRAFARKRHRKNAFVLARHPGTPEDVLLKILADWPGDEAIRHAMVLRPDLPLAVIRKLATKRDPLVQRVLRRRGYGTEEDGMSLGLRDEAVESFLPVWRESTPVFICLMIICLPPQCDKRYEVQALLNTTMYGAYDRAMSWLERLGVALMPRVAERFPEGRQWLETLREDGNRLVRAAARARLADPEASLL